MSVGRSAGIRATVINGNRAWRLSKGDAKGLRLASGGVRSSNKPSNTALLRGAEIVTSIGGALVIAVVFFHRGDVPSITDLERGTSFWLVLGAYLAAQPLCDLLAFRTIWPISWPALPVLFRKTAINEVVFGYLGDLHLYGWARRDPRTCRLAFVAIKDSAIVSALVGNLFTIAMTICALPWLGMLKLGSARFPLEISLLTVLGPLLGASLLRTRIFASSRKVLMRIALCHAFRATSMMLLLCLLWRSVMPAAALSSLLLLGAGRQLLSRLPLAPNKDLIFAGLIALVAVPGSPVGAGTAAVATLIAAAQAIIGFVLLIMSFAIGRRSGAVAGVQNSCQTLPRLVD